jgi:hypothetical protein
VPGLEQDEKWVLDDRVLAQPGGNAVYELAALLHASKHQAGKLMGLCSCLGAYGRAAMGLGLR